MVTPTDEQLIAGIAAQDAAALRTLYDRHVARVYSTALSYLQVEADAEEVAQEVFPRVWRGAANFRSDSQATTWLYRITVNTSLSALDKRGRRHRFSSFFSPADAPPDFHHPETKLKVYQFTALGLLVVNLVLLAVIAFAPARADNAPQPAIDSIGLDAEQHAQFLAYALAHQAQMRKYNAQQNDLLEAYFRQLTSLDAATPGPPPAAVQDIERQKIVSAYQHFLEVKGLLRPEQEGNFPVFVDAVLGQILLEPDQAN